jgi:hypothetical protein
MSSNWRELRPGDELDRVIAARIGYSVVELPPRDIEKEIKMLHGGARPISYKSIYPTWEYQHAGYQIKGDQVHKNLWDTRYRTEREAWKNAPAISVDLTTAIGLWDLIPDDWTPRLVRMVEARGELVTVYKGSIIHSQTHEQIEEWGDEPAYAVARSVMAWMDARQDSSS